MCVPRLESQYMSAKIEGRVHPPPQSDPKSWLLCTQEMPSFCLRSVGAPLRLNNVFVGHIEHVWVSPTDGWVWARACVHDPITLPKLSNVWLSLKMSTPFSMDDRRGEYDVMFVDLVDRPVFPDVDPVRTTCA